MNWWIYIISTLDGISTGSALLAVGMILVTVICQLVLEANASLGSRVKIGLLTGSLTVLFGAASMAAPTQKELKQAKDTYQTICK